MRALTVAVALICWPLPAQEPRFPKSNPEKAFAELKVYDASGSPLRRPREDFEGARKRVGNDPSWAAWLAEQRTEAGDWMAKRRDRVEWVAGWWHDFVSPKDGSFLTWTPDPPGEETLSSPSDPKVRLTPKIMGGWVFGFRSRHTEKMVEAAHLYRVTGDRKYSDWVISQLDFYTTNYQKWPLQTVKNPSRLMHQSLDDANVLVRFIRAARLIEEAATPDQRSRWFRDLFRPEAELLDQSMQRVHNIACWQRAAMAMAALYGKDEKLWQRAIDGPYGIRRQVRDGVTSDYLWFEQSLGYNSYVVSALTPLFEYAALEGRMDDLRQEMASIENLMLAPVYMRFPGGQLPNPADATGGLHRISEASLAAPYRIFPTLPGLRGASTSRSWQTLIDPAAAPAQPVELPEVTSRNMESSRMAILKQGNWQVYFHYGQIDSSHAQAEALNFEAFYKSTDITHDPGTVGYGSPLHAGFYKTGLAHNVPLIDGLGQEGWNPGELVSFEPGKVTARQPLYRKNTSAQRSIEISGERLVDTVDVRSTGAGRASLLLHLQGKVELPEQPAPSSAVEFRVRYPSVVMKVRASATTPVKVTLTRTPDAPPHQRDSLRFDTDSSEASFTTVFEPAP